MMSKLQSQAERHSDADSGGSDSVGADNIENNRSLSNKGGVTTDKIASLNPLFRMQYEKAQGCYVLLFPEGMIKLNPSAAEILKRVDGSNTENAICAELRQAFPDAPDDLEEDVHAFLVHAEQKKWIRYDE
ncbi:pyrroloquinoline quinone biosynthesis peptide chaperone PqqD [Alteromonas sp. IB21]|uniref:pyrroloquinoline quinone biosynthesis peptide chaperone PqqD n=1 Tax=Alteromonas sp. IB21 TaxID=2779369 RepID=UPI0018E8CDF5|nr:pyrroloquinoline quinone biosynthesis peptide chaperone PqqD [Alteromonas sp. IB21]MBJ2129756.1 pyrroloquinoline quinone biosynthesis peptide chaperone PqqD [Alteromonas sp. IB21]